MHKLLKSIIIFSLMTSVCLPEDAEARAKSSRHTRVHKKAPKRVAKQRPVRVRKARAPKRAARVRHARVRRVKLSRAQVRAMQIQQQHAAQVAAAQQKAAQLAAQQQAQRAQLLARLQAQQQRAQQLAQLQAQQQQQAQQRAQQLAQLQAQRAQQLAQLQAQQQQQAQRAQQLAQQQQQAQRINLFQQPVQQQPALNPLVQQQPAQQPAQQQQQAQRINLFQQPVQQQPALNPLVQQQPAQQTAQQQLASQLPQVAPQTASARADQQIIDKTNQALDELSTSIRNSHLGLLGRDLIIQTIDSLKTFTRGAPALVEATTRRLQSRVNIWIDKARNVFLSEDDQANLMEEMISCNRMITSIFKNPGIPKEADMPRKLKINPWMINSPYVDLLNAKQNQLANDEALNVAPNQQAFATALKKIGDLFDRLVAANKITPLRLLDYEAVDARLKAAYDANTNPAYADIIAFANAPQNRHIYNALDFGSKETVVGNFWGRNGILNTNNRTKNRAIVIANQLWKRDENNNEVQVISDDQAAKLLIRLAIGGLHCTTRAEEDTIWAETTVSGAALAESDETLEIKVAALLRASKQKAIDAMVSDEEGVVLDSEGKTFTRDGRRIDKEGYHINDSGRRISNLPLIRRSQIAHLRMRIEKRLAPYIGNSLGAASFADQHSFFSEYDQKPIAEVLQHFNSKFTKELIEADLRSDAAKMFKVTAESQINLTQAELRGKTSDEKRALKRKKYLEQQRGTFTRKDLTDYVDNFSPGRGYDGIIDLDEETYTEEVLNAKSVLFGLGYLEEDDFR